MIEVKLYLYDSTAEKYKGEDLSAYVLSGVQNTEDITEELDVSEITLQGYPDRAEFAPETKFIIEIWENGETVYTFHRCVQEDVVEQPILADEEYFNHTISLIEPAVVAQKRIVDNIAITYQLKKVSLETRSSYQPGTPAYTALNNEMPATPPRGFANYVDRTKYSNTRNTSFGKYFLWKKATETSGISDSLHRVLIVYNDTNGNEQKKDLKYVDYNDIELDTNTQKKYARFEIPVPHIMWGKIDGTDENPTQRPPALISPEPYADIGVANFRVRIIKTDILGEQTEVYNNKFVSSSALGSVWDTTFPYKWACGTLTIPTATKNNFLIERLEPKLSDNSASNVAYADFYFRRYTGGTGATDLSSANVFTSNIEIEDECTYFISLTIEPTNEAPSVPFTAGRIAYAYTASNYSTFDYIKLKNRNVTGGIGAFIDTYAQELNFDVANFGDKSVTCDFVTYTTASATAVLESGKGYTAYNLIVKAIANSETYFKQDGLDISKLDIYNSPYPFYVSEDIADGKVTKHDLELTEINETFFRQKNLWEILLEVGKYCHAIPEISFGENDKFVISFTKLGGTNVSYNATTRKSIMNFRKVDDYVSACSSYVDNLVQLGGKITEKIAPKTQSDDFIVKADTACIIVSKPMIEILSVKAVYGGTDTLHISFHDPDDEDPNHNTDIYFIPNQWKDITDYVYEKNIYGLLSVNKDDVPNKGIALYYELGTNSIVGGDYQLPAVTPNPYSDYALKKILFTAWAGKYYNNFNMAFGTSPWYNLKVLDFTFEVTYRTKDSARVEHTRPDLRHYILSSKHDNYPVHKQFNNQQDVLVDSVAFGGNMFGKLIRTGNSNFKENQWCRYLSELMHKGELYYIDDDRYYVAKATHIFFPDHIESIIEYSKDYNQLSAIIGIPSEPRFWEISERSIIDREVSINDFIVATTDLTNIDDSKSFIADISHTRDLIFGGNGTYLKWALTHYHGDPNMAPEKQSTFGIPNFGDDGTGVKVLNPINAYSCGNTLTYEWDMVDNFSAGDKLNETAPNIGGVADDAYMTMRAVQYCDKYGKGTLFDFYLFGDLPITLTTDQIRKLPINPIYTIENYIVSNMANIGKSIILIKDCRETLHFNYNIMQLTDSDRFILSPFFFSEKANSAKIVALSEEVNKMSNGWINANTIIAETPATASVSGKHISVDMSWINNLTNEQKSAINAIAIMESGQGGTMQKFTIAKNAYSLEATNTWYFGAPNKNNLFTRRQ